MPENQDKPNTELEAPMFKVMLECGPHCEHWEETRETLRTEDAVDAVRQSKMHRDRDHNSWVELVKTGDLPKVQHAYTFSASRKGSGLDGECVSFKSLLSRLESYDKSFPNEIISVVITKIV